MQMDTGSDDGGVAVSPPQQPVVVPSSAMGEYSNMYHHRFNIEQHPATSALRVDADHQHLQTVKDTTGVVQFTKFDNQPDVNPLLWKRSRSSSWSHQAPNNNSILTSLLDPLAAFMPTPSVQKQIEASEDTSLVSNLTQNTHKRHKYNIPNSTSTTETHCRSLSHDNFASPPQADFRSRSTVSRSSQQSFIGSQRPSTAPSTERYSLPLSRCPPHFEYKSRSAHDLLTPLSSVGFLADPRTESSLLQLPDQFAGYPSLSPLRYPESADGVKSNQGKNTFSFDVDLDAEQRYTSSESHLSHPNSCGDCKQKENSEKTEWIFPDFEESEPLTRKNYSAVIYLGRSSAERKGRSRRNSSSRHPAQKGKENDGERTLQKTSSVEERLTNNSSQSTTMHTRPSLSSKQLLEDDTSIREPFQPKTINRCYAPSPNIDWLQHNTLLVSRRASLPSNLLSLASSDFQDESNLELLQSAQQEQQQHERSHDRHHAFTCEHQDTNKGNTSQQKPSHFTLLQTNHHKGLVDEENDISNDAKIDMLQTSDSNAKCISRLFEGLHDEDSFLGDDPNSPQGSQPKHSPNDLADQLISVDDIQNEHENHYRENDSCLDLSHTTSLRSLFQQHAEDIAIENSVFETSLRAEETLGNELVPFFLDSNDLIRMDPTL